MGIGGHCEPPAARSLISALPGSTTIIFTSDCDMYSGSYAWNKLRSVFPESFVEQVKGMTVCADWRSAVFDVPSELAGDIERIEPQWGWRIKICTEMPELAIREGKCGKGGGKGKSFGKGFDKGYGKCFGKSKGKGFDKGSGRGGGFSGRGGGFSSGRGGGRGSGW